MNDPYRVWHAYTHTYIKTHVRNQFYLHAYIYKRSTRRATTLAVRVLAAPSSKIRTFVRGALPHVRYKEVVLFHGFLLWTLLKDLGLFLHDLHLLCEHTWRTYLTRTTHTPDTRYTHTWHQFRTRNTHTHHVLLHSRQPRYYTHTASSNSNLHTKLHTHLIHTTHAPDTHYTHTWHTLRTHNTHTRYTQCLRYLRQRQLSLSPSAWWPVSQVCVLCVGVCSVCA